MAPGVLVEVWDVDGRASPPRAGCQPLACRGPPLPTRESALGWRAGVIANRGWSARPRLTRPIVEDHRTVAVVRVGESLHVIDNALGGLVRLLIVGGALVLIACVLVTWLAVTRALEPLESMAATAEHIASTGDIGVSVSTRGTSEVSRMGVAFGRMVDRLRKRAPEPATTTRRHLARVAQPPDRDPDRHRPAWGGISRPRRARRSPPKPRLKPPG